jgi:signal transduction histidine kinase
MVENGIDDSSMTPLEVLRERTARLLRLTAHLSTALRATDVAEIVVDEGTTALGALTGALWRLDHGERRLVLMRAIKYPDDALATIRTVPLDPEIPIADAAIRGEPVWLSSKADYAARYGASAARTRELATHSYSVAALPVVLRGEVLGVMALTFAGERAFDDDERSYLTFLTLHCAQGFDRARLYAAEEAAKDRAMFLARSSEVLGSSLDYEDTLRNVASLAVPKIGDWCGIELVDESGNTKQVAVAHVDPSKIELAHELRRRYPPDPHAKTGVPNVLRTGISELYPEIPDELLVAGAIDEEHLRISRELGLRSAMIVPIKERGEILGVITFVATDPGRRYGPDDRQMAEQLAERAGAAIANEKLYSAAREAIRIRDEFMLVAGHELRTPLSALSLHHEALVSTRDGTPLEKIRERGAKLVAQGHRLSRLVEDLLDVSRISAGRLALECEDLDLGELTREIVDRMRDEFARARAPLTLDIEPVRGRWDRSRLDQVITNLLSNALKYGMGSPVDVRVARTADGVILTVTDRGIGIAPEDQLRVFKRFERAVSSRKFGGLGLGLWIAGQLVEAHRGTIAVSSQPGSGSTFTVTLPAE